MPGRGFPWGTPRHPYLGWGIPWSNTGWGTPIHDWMRYPPIQTWDGIPPIQDYAAGGMLLVFTQEDFLVLFVFEENIQKGNYSWNLMSIWNDKNLYYLIK